MSSRSNENTTTDYTQANRPIAVYSPLGEDKLLLRSFAGHEGISQLFSFQLDLLSTDFNISFNDIIGQKLTIALELSDGSSRYFNGLVSRFVQLPGEGRLARYQAEMSPWLWFLTRTVDCVIFQNKTIPEIVQAIFEKFGFTDFKIDLQRTYKSWEY